MCSTNVSTENSRIEESGRRGRHVGQVLVRLFEGMRGGGEGCGWAGGAVRGDGGVEVEGVGGGVVHSWR